MKSLVTEEYVCEIAVGILEKEWPEIEKKLEAARGFAKTIHVDLADGKMVPNTSFMDPKPFAKYAKDFDLELHMMVENPIQYLKPFADAGFKRFVGHVEKMPNVTDFVAEGQLYGEVGLALDQGTSVNSLDLNLDNLDCVTIMTIKAGFSGQQFMEDQLQKIKDVHKTSMIPVEVDGGVKDTNIMFAKNAGAVRFVATSFIWGSEDPKASYEKLQSIISPR